MSWQSTDPRVTPPRGLHILFPWQAAAIQRLNFLKPRRRFVLSACVATRRTQQNFDRPLDRLAFFPSVPQAQSHCKPHCKPHSTPSSAMDEETPAGVHAKEVTRLWRAWRTIHEMVQDRVRNKACWRCSVGRPFADISCRRATSWPKTKLRSRSTASATSTPTTTAAQSTHPQTSPSSLYRH